MGVSIGDTITEPLNVPQEFDHRGPLQLNAMSIAKLNPPTSSAYGSSTLISYPAPHGGQIEVPVAPGQDDPYRNLDDPEAWREYYAEHGYVVIRNLIPVPTCDQARTAFVNEVKPYNGHLYRQASASPERHRLSPHGYVLNSLLNLQDIRRSRFPQFYEAGMNVLTSAPLLEAVQALFHEPGRLVQSMYFEGNPVTWAHQDTYYLDSDRLGGMTGAWIALEDIHHGAGRFYVYPGSHRIDMVRNGGDFDIAFNHLRYKQLVIDVINRHGLECRVPALNKGDVLFWSSKTIHGSLETQSEEHSRNSITAHFIPLSTQFVQYQTRVRKLHLRQERGLEVHSPKDQNRWLNRAALRAEVLLGPAFQFAKKSAVKFVTR